jgi:hypothetical protein
VANKRGVVQLFVILTSLAFVTVGLWTLIVADDKSEWGSVSGRNSQDLWTGVLRDLLITP